MENTNFLFNEASEAHWEKLKPEERQFVVKNREDALKEVKTLRADHLANRDQRIADEEKRIAGKPEPSPHPKPPPGVADIRKPQLKASEIRAMAESKIDKAYTDRIQAIVRDGRQAERDYIKKALNIEPRGPEKSDHGIDRT